MECCGEVIDEEECRRRLFNLAKGQHSYFISLEKNLFIDAGRKGNLARFMNHSCEPNCISEKWEVEGLTRIGLFALCDIKEGIVVRWVAKFY